VDWSKVRFVLRLFILLRALSPSINRRVLSVVSRNKSMYGMMFEKKNPVNGMPQGYTVRVPSNPLMEALEV
jgi:hypothetical protein